MVGWKRILGTKKELILALFLAVLLAACAAPVAPTASATVAPTRTPRTPIPSRTPITPTMTPSITSTPYTVTPTSPPVAPLTAHEWQPKKILVQFGTQGIPDGIPILNPFTLYGDGRLITVEESLGYQRVLESWLDRGETCRLLNAIDQTGFLTYDHTIYEPGGGDHNRYIEVNAWSSTRVTPLLSLD